MFISQSNGLKLLVIFSLLSKGTELHLGAAGYSGGQECFWSWSSFHKQCKDETYPDESLHAVLPCSSRKKLSHNWDKYTFHFRCRTFWSSTRPLHSNLKQSFQWQQQKSCTKYWVYIGTVDFKQKFAVANVHWQFSRKRKKISRIFIATILLHISLFHGPWCNHFISMLLCVVMSKGIPCFKYFSTNNTGMAHVQMNFCVSFHSLFCVKVFGAHWAGILSFCRSEDHRLDNSVKI